ncbi:extracellular solute-binding protein [Paenibacillus sp. MBLB4367]|uniref:extracellular solute-binding protein n=1 Tax=Paenibacillus sp. MBLB4367 TaxID=3384767 RepID=UPI003907EBD7
MKIVSVAHAATLTALAITLTSCGNKDSNPSGSAQSATPPVKTENFSITLRHTQVKDTQQTRFDMLQDVVKATETAVPGLKIELDGVEDTVNRDTTLKAEMATGSPPKIFDLFGGTDTKNYVKADRLLDLTPILQELGLREHFISLDEFTVDGKVYGLPMAGYVEGVYYNKAIFRKLNASVPATWDEFLGVCDLVKRSGYTPLALASKEGWAPLMTANYMWVRLAGADSVAGFVSGSKKWNDSEVVEAFTKYDLLLKNGYMQANSLALKYLEQAGPFMSGQAAMMVDGSWANSPLIDPGVSKIADDVGFFPFPDMNGPGDGLIMGGYSNGYGFSKELNERQLSAVKQFIVQMFNEKMQKRQLLEAGMLPSMKLTDLSGVKPIIQEILNVVNNAKGVFPAHDAVVQQKVKEAVERGIQEQIGGRTGPRPMLDMVQSVQEAANRTKPQ